MRRRRDIARRSHRGVGDVADDPAVERAHRIGVLGEVHVEVKDRAAAISFKSFAAFTAGAAERAKLVGDTGASAPENWIGDFGKGCDHERHLASA